MHVLTNTNVMSKVKTKPFHHLDNAVYVVFLLWVCNTNLVIIRQKRAILRPRDDIQ